MNKIFEYTQSAVNTAAPYIKEAGGYAISAAESVKRNLKKSKKKAKRQLRIIRIKNFIELMTNLILIIAAVIGIVLAVLEVIRRDGE